MRFVSTERILSFALLVFTCFWVLIATERQAWGYVDPGSGLLALQTFASVMAACGYFLRRRLRKLFGWKTAQTRESTEGTKDKKLRKAA